MENLEGGDISEVSGGESSVDTAPPPEAQEQDTSELQPPEGETAPVEAEDTDSSTDAGDLGGAEGSALEQPDPATDPAMDAGNSAMTEGTQPTEQPNPEDGEHLPETDSGVAESPDGGDTEKPDGSDAIDADQQELPVENPEGTQEIPETPEAGDSADADPDKQAEQPKQPEQPDEQELPENTETDPVAEKTDDPDAAENPEDPEKNDIKDGSDTSEQPVPKEELDKKELEEPTEQPENQEENQPENQEQGHEVPPPDDGERLMERPQETPQPEVAYPNEVDVTPEGLKLEPISDETKEALGAFEQNNWDNLTPEEREQAISDLRDSIANDLGLENKPNIDYYYNPSTSDYGGYSPSNNTIYINNYNIGDAAETADTVAHESRHCWQHERADNPQTEQDYRFKENFDDYIRPEDDFEAYQQQPVEKDAREYGQAVKDAIPQSQDAPASLTPTESFDGTVKPTESPALTTGPPEHSYEKTALPEDFQSKVDEKYVPMNGRAQEKCEAAGLSPEQVQQIRELPNGQKPNPEDYLSKDYIDNHLQKFEDNGCYKFIGGEPNGTLGKGDSIFVIDGKEAEAALADANGDPRKLEEILGMPKGYLGDNPYIVKVENAQGLRMPTGNEENAWQTEWCPGGMTVGGANEAVISPVSPENYSFKPCFENNQSVAWDSPWNKH